MKFWKTIFILKSLIFPFLIPFLRNRYNGLNYATLGEHKLSFDMRTAS